MIINQISKLLTISAIASVFLLSACSSDSNSKKDEDYGNSLSLDGVDDYVFVSDLSADKTHSIAAWVNITVNTEDWNTMFDFANNPAMGVDDFESDSLWNIYDSSDNVLVSKDKALDKQWVHVVFIYGGTTLYIYENGLEVASITTTALDLNTSPEFYIGSVHFEGEYITGLIDEVSVWNKELTADDVKELMTKTLDGDEEGLVAYYNFDEILEEGETKTVKNIAKPGTYDGVLLNGATTVPTTLDTSGL